MDAVNSRLVAGGHRTPDIPQEEVYSGVVSVETIRTAFVISALNGLEVCAADISTAFLYGRTHEKVYVIAGPEFGEHAAREWLIDGGLYGLKTSLRVSMNIWQTKLCKMGFKPSKADYDLWYHALLLQEITMNMSQPMWMISLPSFEIPWQLSMRFRKITLSKVLEHQNTILEATSTLPRM